MHKRRYVGDAEVSQCPVSHSDASHQTRWAPPGYRGRPDPPWDPDAATSLDEAVEFLHRFHHERGTTDQLSERLAAVTAEITATGTYQHAYPELQYGARLAWRNASRCIGRLYWQRLEVRDRRDVGDAHTVAAELIEHLDHANNGGRIRPVITVFGAAKPGKPHLRVWNEQLVRYAGYRDDTGAITGDPRYLRFTETVTDMGWRGAKTHFDVLPWVIETPEDQPQLFQPPPASVLEVPISHPEYEFVAEMQVKWHAVPAITNMRLEIGGVSYPCAPFNGWYMGTEIGARNLADANRYNLLPTFAKHLGLDTSSEATLWRDRALVELNRAVLHSFEQRGIKITDHHTEADHFAAHIEREGRAGRAVPADWTWIIPPMSPATTVVWDRGFHEADLKPNFYLDKQAQVLAGLR